MAAVSCAEHLGDPDLRARAGERLCDYCNFNVALAGKTLCKDCDRDARIDALRARLRDAGERLCDRCDFNVASAGKILCNRCDFEVGDLIPGRDRPEPAPGERLCDRCEVNVCAAGMTLCSGDMILVGEERLEILAAGGRLCSHCKWDMAGDSPRGFCDECEVVVAKPGDVPPPPRDVDAIVVKRFRSQNPTHRGPVSVLEARRFFLSGGHFDRFREEIGFVDKPLCSHCELYKAVEGERLCQGCKWNPDSVVRRHPNPHPTCARCKLPEFPHRVMNGLCPDCRRVCPRCVLNYAKVAGDICESCEEDLRAMKEEPGAEQPKTKQEEPKHATVNLATVTSLDVDWFWEPYIPRGMLTDLVGDSGVGKTGVLYDLAARYTRGWPMPPNEERTQVRDPGNVLIILPEDTLAHGVKPRLEAAGADVGRIEVLSLWNAAHAGTLRAIVEEHSPGLIIIDSIMSALGEAKRNTSADAEIRAVLLHVARIVEDYNCAAVYVRHSRKAETAKAIHVGGGSVGFTALARSALLLGVHPEEPDRKRVLTMIKTNCGPMADSLEYEVVPVEVPGLEQKKPKIHWLGRTAVTANEVASYSPESEKRGEERLRCALFLLRYFAAGRGATPVGVIKAAAREQGLEVSEKTWTRARADAGVITIGRGQHVIWAPTAGTVASLAGDAADDFLH